MWYGYYTPYHQDMDDIARRKRNKPSKFSTLMWILAWFILLMVFA